MRAMEPAARLWMHVFGSENGVLGLFSGTRPEPGSPRLEAPHSGYFAWPDERHKAEGWAENETQAGREVYQCGHLLSGRRRVKENAAPLLSLYVDGDGAKVGDRLPEPTAVVESSPGREQFWWALSHSVSPLEGEELNRRLSYAMRADLSGWDLTQLLRVPGTRNRKYPKPPLVRLIELNDASYDPAELNKALPLAPQEPTKMDHRSERPQYEGISPDLDRLSPRMQDLILHGNGAQYACRSRADMAACVAMFGAGYTEAEVWAVMTDPTNGISEKFLEKGRQGERYLSLTIGKAQARANALPPLRRRPSKSKARRIQRRGAGV